MYLHVAVSLGREKMGGWTLTESSGGSEDSRVGGQSSSEIITQAADIDVSEVVRLSRTGCIVCRAQGPRIRYRSHSKKRDLSAAH